MKNIKFWLVLKKTVKIVISGETSPFYFLTGGTRPSVPPPGVGAHVQGYSIQCRGPLSRTEAALLSIYVLVLELRPQCTTTFLRDARVLLSGIGSSSRTSI